MKARSVIFTKTQFPTTALGFPPMLMAGSGVVAMVAYALPFLIGWVPLAMPLAGVAFVLSLAWCRTIAQADKHCVSVFFTSFAFWGPSQRRWLSAGAMPSRSRRARP